MPNVINHPAHYNAGEIECIDALEAAVSGLNGIEAFCTASAIKYLWRWKYKGGEQDLCKAKWYIDYLLEKGGYENISVLEKLSKAERDCYEEELEEVRRQLQKSAADSSAPDEWDSFKDEMQEANLMEVNHND